MPTSALVRTIVENIDKSPQRTKDEVRYFDTTDEAKAWLSSVG
jgi:hypothetical protein